MLYLSYNYHNRASNHPLPPPVLSTLDHPRCRPTTSSLPPSMLCSNSRNRKLETREYIFPSLLSRSSRSKLFTIGCQPFENMLTTPWKIIRIETLIFVCREISCILCACVESAKQSHLVREINNIAFLSTLIYLLLIYPLDNICYMSTNNFFQTFMIFYLYFIFKLRYHPIDIAKNRVAYNNIPSFRPLNIHLLHSSKTW